LPSEIIAKATNELFDIAKSECVAPVSVPALINQKLEEKHRLEQEIIEADKVLQEHKPCCN